MVKNNSIWFLLSLTLYCGCGNRVMPAPKPPINKNFVTLSSADADTVSIVGNLYKGEAPFWTPTNDDIGVLENALPTYLKSHSPQSGTAVNLANYRRQYFGCTKNGRKVVFVNAFCGNADERHKGWRNRIVFVKDGGECCFQVIYDVEKGNFSSLHYNGYA